MVAERVTGHSEESSAPSPRRGNEKVGFRYQEDLAIRRPTVPIATG